MKNKTINYTELLRRTKELNDLKKKGFIIIPKRTFKITGWCLIGLGIITLPIPLTTIPLLAIGFLLLGISKQELIEKIRKKFKLMLYKLRSRF